MWNPLSSKVGTNFANKWRSLGRYSSFAGSGQGIFLVIWNCVRYKVFFCNYEILLYRERTAERGREGRKEVGRERERKGEGTGNKKRIRKARSQTDLNTYGKSEIIYNLFLIATNCSRNYKWRRPRELINTKPTHRLAFSEHRNRT
jgi:hypothetical protein